MRPFRAMAEFFCPARKCERIGHAEVEDVNIEGFAWPSTGFRGVADDFVGLLHVCERCREQMREPTITHRSSIHSLEMDSDRWRRLKAKGFLVCKSWPA